MLTFQIAYAAGTPSGGTINASYAMPFNYAMLINNASDTNKTIILNSYKELFKCINNIFMGNTLLDPKLLQTAYTNYQKSIISLGITATLVPAPTIVLNGIPLELNDQLQAINASSIKNNIAPLFSATPLKISFNCPSLQTQLTQPININVTPNSYTPTYLAPIQKALADKQSSLFKKLLLYDTQWFNTTKNKKGFLIVNAAAPTPSKNYDATDYIKEIQALGCPNNAIPVPYWSDNTPIVNPAAPNGNLVSIKATPIKIIGTYHHYEDNPGKSSSQPARRKHVGNISFSATTNYPLTPADSISKASSIQKLQTIGAYNLLASILSGNITTNSTQIVAAYQNYKSLIAQLLLGNSLPEPQFTINGKQITSIQDQISLLPNLQTTDINTITSLFCDPSQATLSITFPQTTATALQQLWKISLTTTTAGK